MSSMERNKGKLVPLNIDTEHFNDDDWETIYENEFVVIGDEVYHVVWEVHNDTDDCGFAEVTVNDDGTIDFHTYHYNGGGGLDEVIEAELKKG